MRAPPASAGPGIAAVADQIARYAADRAAPSVFHLAGAPAASQAASICRSFAVISVTLPGGIAFERTALMSIRRAWRRMLSGVEHHAVGRRMDPGPDRLAGVAHAAAGGDHVVGGRDVEPRRGACSRRSRGPAAESHATATMPAAATPQVHHGLPLPSWRELKKWRMTGPIASTIATISQLKRVATAADSDW